MKTCLTTKLIDKYTKLMTAMASHTYDLHISMTQMEPKLVTLEDNMQELLDMCKEDGTHWDKLLHTVHNKHDGLRADFDKLVSELNNGNDPLRTNTMSLMDVCTHMPHLPSSVGSPCSRNRHIMGLSMNIQLGMVGVTQTALPKDA